MKQFPFRALLLSCCLSACSGGPSQQPEASKPVVPTEAVTPAAPVAATVPTPDTPAAAKNQAMPARILTEGVFHADEVWEGAAAASWFGLFQHEQEFYLQATRISAMRVRDEILDEGDAVTGWKVKAAGRDSCLLLISGLDYLQNRKVKAVPLSQTQILPGEQVNFTYKGRAYSLSATGTRRRESPGNNGYIISDYRLFLSSRRGGQERKQQLLSQPEFDDAMIDIRFAGDLDGDDIPDLIIDKSNHYNLTNPTLYLSKPAGEGAILKAVGEHASVGC